MMESESESCSVVSDSLWPHGLYSPWNSPGQNTGVGSLSLLRGTFPTQGSNPGFDPHCRWVLYQLSHKGIPRILKWLAYPFSSGSSWPRNWTWVSWIAGGFFVNRAIREAIISINKRKVSMVFRISILFPSYLNIPLLFWVWTSRGKEIFLSFLYVILSIDSIDLVQDLKACYAVKIVNHSSLVRKEHKKNIL